MKLMIVDDEPFVLSGIRDTIPWHKDGITVVAEASDGRSALTKALHFTPDIIICDIRMPHMDGIQFVKQLHSLLPDIQVIMLTAFAEKEYMLEAIRCGVSDFLLKPAGFDLIRQAVLKAKEKLITRREEQQLLEQKSSLLERDATAFRTHYIRGYLNGTEPLQKILQVIPLLQIPLYGPEYLMILMKLPSIRKWETQQTLLSDLACWNPVMVQMQDDALAVMILNVQDLRSGASVYTQTKNCISKIDESTLLILSRNTDKLEELPEVWGSLLEDMRHCSLKHQSGVYYGENIAQQTIDQSCIAKYVNQLLTANAKTSDEEQKALIGTCFDEMVQNGFSSESIVTVLDAYASHIKQHSGLWFSTDGLLELSLSDFRTEMMMRTFRPAIGERKVNTGHEGRALRYIEQHYQQDLSLERVAQALYLSPTYLSRLLNDKTDRGFVGWLRYYRIEHAKRLLRQGKMKKYEIAQSVGYRSYKVFAQHFQQETGISVSEWTAHK